MRKGWMTAVRGLLVAVTLTVSVALPTATARAQAPPPNLGTRTPERESGDIIDLAALVLRPSDIDETGYGITSGWYSSLGEIATFFNDLLGGRASDVADVEARLEAAGWQRGYGLRLAVPSEDDPDVRAVEIVSELALLATEEDAADYVALRQETLASIGLRRERDAAPVGEGSVAYRGSGEFNDGSPWAELNISFQVGRIAAEVDVYDLTGGSPALETAESAAAVLADRIAEGADGSAGGLADAVLRLNGEGLDRWHTYYERLDGNELALYGESSAEVRERDQNKEEDGIESNVFTRQSFFVREDSSDFLDYQAYVYQFDGDEAASAAMASWPDGFVEDPGSRYSDVERPRRQPDVGDGSVAIGYTWERSDGSAAPGYTIYARVGDLMFQLYVDSQAGVPLAEVVPIAEAMATCLGADEPCAEMERPDSLMPPG
jgi:hypothetical protein